AKVHVREIAVLRISRPHADRAGIALSDLQIDVAHGRVKRTGAGVARHAQIQSVAAAAARLLVGRRGAPASGAGTPPGAEPHVTFVSGVLVTGGVWAEQEDGPRGAVADDANRRPDIDGLSDAIPAFRHEYNPLVAGRLHLVDGLLNRVRVIGHAVAAHRKG